MYSRYSFKIIFVILIIFLIVLFYSICVPAKLRVSNINVKFIPNNSNAVAVFTVENKMPYSQSADITVLFGMQIIGDSSKSGDYYIFQKVANKIIHIELDKYEKREISVNATVEKRLLLSPLIAKVVINKIKSLS